MTSDLLPHLIKFLIRHLGVYSLGLPVARIPLPLVAPLGNFLSITHLLTLLFGYESLLVLQELGVEPDFSPLLQYSTTEPSLPF